jgi:hypothetical protein
MDTPKIMVKLVTGEDRQIGWSLSTDDGSEVPIVYDKAKLAMRGRGAFAVTLIDVNGHEICGDKIIELWEEPVPEA